MDGCMSSPSVRDSYLAGWGVKNKHYLSWEVRQAFTSLSAVVFCDSTATQSELSPPIPISNGWLPYSGWLIATTND